MKQQTPTIDDEAGVDSLGSLKGANDQRVSSGNLMMSARQRGAQRSEVLVAFDSGIEGRRPTA
jgi:hypothetical protein